MHETQDNVLLVAAIVRPFLEIFLSVFVPLIVGALAVRLNGYIGYKTEDERLKGEEALRLRLHEAAENALTFAMTKLGYRLSTPEMESGLLTDLREAKNGSTEALIRVNSIYEAAVQDYLKPKMADTIKKLGASDQDLEDIVVSKVARV
jgi:hypothetical protein